MSFQEWQNSPEHKLAEQQEDAWFEYNRVELSLGTVLLLTWWFMPRLAALICLGLLVAFAVLRRIPPLLPILRYIWRVGLMPLAKTDDWIMERWRRFKVSLGIRMIEWRNDWIRLEDWMRLALSKKKDERIVAAMAQHQGFLGERFLSPVNVLGRWVPAIAFGLGMILAGGIQSLRIHAIKADLREASKERDAAASEARRWAADAAQKDKDYKALAEQRAEEHAQLAAESIKSAEVLKQRQRAHVALARRERARNEDAAKAAAGGPPPDWDGWLRKRADPNPAGPGAADAGAAPEAAGDPPG